MGNDECQTEMGVEKQTFGTKICATVVIGSALEPARLHAVKPAVTVDKVLTGHVNRAISVAQDDAAATADDESAYEEGEEKEEEGGEDDEEGEENKERVAAVAWGLLWGHGREREAM